MAASMSAQAAALKPILAVLGNHSASREAQLDPRLSSPSARALGLAAARAAGEPHGEPAGEIAGEIAGEEAADEAAGPANARERLGAREASELQKAQRLVGQAERDQQTALAALTLARKVRVS